MKKKKKVKKSTRDWSDAPPEIICLIASRLHSIEDCTSFRAVCTSWRSALLNYPHCIDVSLKAIPWIMFAQEPGDNNTHDFLSLSVKKHYELDFPENTNHLPITGSGHGWLVLQKDVGSLEIYNPLTRVRVPLPLLSALKDYSNIFLATSPSSLSTAPPEERFIVFVFSVIEGKVAFARPRDRIWSLIDFVVKSCCDILLLKSHVYVVDKEGLVRRFDITGASPVELEFALPPAGIGRGVHWVYLVGILGDLYMIVEFGAVVDYNAADDDGGGYRKFKVFKLDLETQKWKEVFTLGDYAIFVSPTSFSLPVSDYPESKSTICSMEVLSTDPMQYKNQLRVFNLETRTLFNVDLRTDASKQSARSSWFIPSLY